MATVTAAQSGLWSSGTTWDSGSPPADGDTFVIPSGITVTYDYDMSSFTTGMAGGTVDGILEWKPDVDTYFKLGGEVSGNGEIYIGKEDSRITAKATLEATSTTAKFSGNYKQLKIEVRGDIRNEKAFSFLAENYEAGVTQIKLKDNMQLRPGDIIWLGQKNGSPSDIESFTVSAYDSETKTVTLSSATTLEHYEDDLVVLETRSIQIIGNNPSGSGFFYVLFSEHLIIEGVYVEGLTLIQRTSNAYMNYVILKNSGRLFFSSGEWKYGKNLAVVNTNSTTTVFSYGSHYFIENLAILGFSANTIFSRVQGVGIVKNFYIQNASNITKLNNDSGVLKLFNVKILQDLNYFSDISVGETTIVNGENISLDVYHFPSQSKIYNTTFNTLPDVETFTYQDADNINTERHNSFKGIEIFNLNKVSGHYRKYDKTGVIDTDFVELYNDNPTLKFYTNKDTLWVSRDYTIYLKQGDSLFLRIPVKKNWSGRSYLPKVQIFPAWEDPYVFDTASYMKEFTIPHDSENTWEVILVNYIAQVEGEHVIRIMSKGNQGDYTWFYTGEIEQNTTRIDVKLEPRLNTIINSPF